MKVPENMKKKMMYRIKYLLGIKYLLALLVIPATAAFSQPRLTLQDAVRIGLENNYSIKISAAESEAAANNVTPGNAGFLPSVDADASISHATENVRTTTRDGVVNSVSAAGSNNRSAGVQLSWTVFDGMRMFISYDRLKQFRTIGELKARQAVEENVAGITDAYYNTVSIQQNIDAIRYAVTVSEDRVRLTEDKYNLGSASKLELLQARVDLNADRASLLREEIRLKNARTSLNSLMGRKPGEEFSVQDTIIVEPSFNYDELRASVVQNNYSLRLSEKDIRVSELDLQALRAEWMPQASAFASYEYSNSLPGSGTFSENRRYGLTYGLSLRWNLFEGFNTQRRLENAAIGLRISRLSHEDELNRVLAAFESQWANYKRGLELLDMEAENLAVARQTIEVAYEKLKYGEYSAIEFREAQRSYLNAQSRLVAAQYSAKQAEIQLSRLAALSKF